MLEGEPRLLLVEDDKQIQEFLTDALRDEGYDVRLAVNGRQALEALRDWRPHLILLDLRMPGMDGREFVQTYRAQETEAAQRAQRPVAPVPIILVTASRIPEVDPEEFGASGVLRKPFEVDALLENVARHTRGAAS